MVKENNLKLVNPTPKTYQKKASSTTLSSIVVSVVVVIAISLIGLSFAYMFNSPSYLDTIKGCTDKIHGFEQKGSLLIF
jgi:hypothetical protein